MCAIRYLPSNHHNLGDDTMETTTPTGVRLIENRSFDDSEKARTDLLELYRDLRLTDVVVGDGVVVVPRDRATTVAEIARRINEGDETGRRKHYERTLFLLRSEAKRSHNGPGLPYSSPA